MAVAARSSVPSSRLAASLIHIEESNFEDVYFVFSSPSEHREFESIPEEVVERIEPYILRHTPKNRGKALESMQQLQSELEDVSGDCPALVDYQNSLEAVAADERAEFIRQRLPQAWLDCECEADIEFIVAMKSSHTEIHRGVDGPMLATAIEISVDEVLEFLENHHETPWGDLAAEFGSSNLP